MDNTSKMIQLLGSLRKEMNGAVADSMYYYGDNYGLNYGVSLPTIRSRATEFGKDHELARYLYKQQVRELRLASLHIAEPALLNITEAEYWADGVINSEIAEEMAFALLRHSKDLKAIFEVWTNSCNKFLVHSALMAAARSELASNREVIEKVTNIAIRFSDERIIAQGIVALLSAALNANVEPSTKEFIRKIIDSIPQSPVQEYINEEMEWRMEL